MTEPSVGNAFYPQGSSKLDPPAIRHSADLGERDPEFPLESRGQRAQCPGGGRDAQLVILSPMKGKA